MGRLGWVLLGVTGIVFWFALGFPFAHHNESYDWAAWIDVADPTHVTWRPFFGSGGYRPLAMTTAWASYHGSGGSLVPIQLFNFAVTVAAWAILVLSVNERRTMALASLAVGGALFTGYIYLFHLHGVFYGPMLLWLALAVRFCLGFRPTPREYAVVAVLALVSAAYHPYSLVLALALTVAAPFEFRWFADRRAIAIVAVLALLGVALVIVVWPKHLTAQLGVKLAALLASARTIEVARPVSIVTLLLAVGTAWMTRWPESLGRRAPLVAVLVTAAAAIGAFVAGLPVVCVWLAAALVKLLVHRRWALAAMLAASVGLPFAGGSGSPTYAVFAIALATVAIAVDATGIELALTRVPDGGALGAAAAILVLAGVVRAGVDVPVVSRLVQPVVAERERTHQLARLLERALASPYRSLPMRFAHDADAPVEGGGGIDRSQRPPTQQVCLDAYLDHVRGAADPNAQAGLRIAFGQPMGEDGAFVEPSAHAGNAVAALVMPRTER